MHILYTVDVCRATVVNTVCEWREQEIAGAISLCAVAYYLKPHPPRGSRR